MTMKFVDEAGQEVLQDDATMYKAIYTVETPTALSGPSVETIMVLA